MRNQKLLCWITIACALAASSTLAQVPTGTLSGHASDGQESLPGVTIMATSPNLQGSRTAVTEVSGDYIFRFLPPGEYRVRFSLQGFQSLDTTVKISAAQTSVLNAVMPIAQVAEEVTVTGTYDTISATQQVATTYEAKLIESLPVARTIVGAVALTPGVSDTGPVQAGRVRALAIAGALSYENLFMVNGVVITDNVRGTPNALFIEDAIQETTTQTGAVSAEYGRFSGGVVNTVTKSGGNEFTGSLRSDLTNDKWTAKTPLSVEPKDKINSVYSMTFGGYIFRDKLWFFTSARYFKTENTLQTFATNLPYTFSNEQGRYEGKLTYSITPNHRLTGNYYKIDQTQRNNSFSNILDLASLDLQRELPQDLRVLNYTGVLTESLFLEGQYSKRRYSFVGSGGDYSDYIRGTVIKDNVNYYLSNSPAFCGVCDQERRDNENYLLKASYFLATPSMGSHDLVAGFDRYNDMVKSNNHQSGSGWIYWPTEYLTDDGGNFVLDPVLNQPIPVVYGDGSSDFTYWAMLNSSKGTNLVTQSAYLNDKWRLSNNLTLSLGVRYDKNDAEDASHRKVAKDSRFSPRLGVSWDIKGDGAWVVNASYGHYVTALANNIADQGGGSPSPLGYFYEGPDLNSECTAANPGACLNAHQVLERVFAWLFENGTNAIGAPVDRPIGYGYISGISQVVGDNLRSPYSREYTLGFSRRLGARGMARLDYTHRDFNDMYIDHLDMTTGQVQDDIIGDTYDLDVIENSNELERVYDGFNLQAAYRLSDVVSLGGNYTWSRTWGNFEGETANSGPVANSFNPHYYPEYQEQRWLNPKGYLATDRRHTARIWGVWDVLSTKSHQVAVSVMQSYFTGMPYSAIGTIRMYNYVTNPGYVTPPTTQQYYFSRRAAYRTEDTYPTDLKLIYSFKLPTFGRDLEIFVEPAVTNVFNQQRASNNVDTTVLTRYTGGGAFAPLNPFTQAPIECPQGASGDTCAQMGAHWQKGPNFGEPVADTDYQAPRTFTFSVGVRF